MPGLLPVYDKGEDLPIASRGWIGFGHFMLTLASGLSLHIVVMPPFFSARGITTLLKKETGQTKVLRVLCYFIQAQKG
jgi:hypothetical protein